MALLRIRPVPGFESDHHLIRLLPSWPALKEFFEVIDDTLGRYNLASPPAGNDITSVVFRAGFDGAPSSHGVTVDTGTGAITLAASASATPLNNFLLVVEVNHTSTKAASPERNGLRIHIHDNIQSLLLTPNPLVGRKDATDVRFTVLGLFSDSVIGDITDWTVFRTPHPVSGALIPLVELHSDTPGTVAIEPGKQRLILVSPGTATITADLRGSPTSISVTAQCEPPWSTPTEATFVDGPGEAARDAVPNILFLPDGFETADKTTFENLVLDIVRNGLFRNSFLAPYNHLSHSINYWSCFVASPRPGVSVLSEVGRLRGSGTSFRGVPITRPSKPSPAATTWTLEELVHEVGLPVPAQAAVDRGPLVAGWQTLFGSGVTDAKVRGEHKTVGGAKVEVWDFWRSLSDRVLLNEVSTAFGVAVGGRHSADCVGSLARHLVTNPRRLNPTDFDTFVRNLQFKDPTAGGALVTFGDRWGFGGKDQGLVCIIARTRYSAGTNVGFLYTSSLGEEKEHPISTAGGGFNVVPPPIASTAPSNVLSTVAHESSHSFSCGDEYAGDCSHGEPPSATRFGNLQLAGENGLFVAAPPTIDASKIKWLWPRINKAGVLRSDPDRPDPVGNPEKLVVELRPGHSAFAVDDVLRFRARPLIQHPKPSFRLKVKTVTPDAALGDTLELEQTEGLPTVITLGDFPAGSVLLRPVVGPAPPGDDVLLVHPDIVAHLRDHDGPLNAPLGAPTRDCATEFAANKKPFVFRVQMATNLPATLRHGTRTQPTWGSWIVGLYEGGLGFPCGIFHPTGACLMRALEVPRESLSGTPIVAGFDTEGRRIPPPGTLYKFCPVCRYILVDAVDPTKHPVIDAEYVSIFPA